MRPGDDRESATQARVGVPFLVGVGGRLGLRRRQRRQLEQLEPRAVHHQLDLVRLGQSFDPVVAIAGEPNLELVLAVLREHVAERGAAARAERQRFIDLIVLRQVERQHHALRTRRAQRRADGEPADLARRRDVLIEQRRRQLADVDVVEAVARVVARQHRRGVHFEREQVAHGVLVFGPVQPVEGLGPARVGMLRRVRVERGFQIRQQRRVLTLVGTEDVAAMRRHRADAQLADRFLPRRRILADVVDVEPVEIDVAGEVQLVVTVDAVAIHDRPRPGGHRGLGRRAPGVVADVSSPVA